MPSVYDIKPAFQRFLRPAVSRIHGVGITPNQVTVAALVLSIVMGAWLFVQSTNPLPWLLLPLWLFLRMALNAIDGMIAKTYDLTSRTGAILNEAGDILADLALYLPLIRLPGMAPEPVLAFLFLSVATELVGISGIWISGTRRFEGPMGKSDRALIMGIAGLLIGIGKLDALWLSRGLLLCCVLLVLTIFNRWRKALGEKRE